MKVFSRPGNEVDGIMVEKKNSYYLYLYYLWFIYVLEFIFIFIFIYVHDFHYFK